MIQQQKDYQNNVYTGRLREKTHTIISNDAEEIFDKL